MGGFGEDTGGATVSMWIVVVIIHPRHFAAEWQTPVFAIVSFADEHGHGGKWMPFFEKLCENTVAQVGPYVSSNGDSGSSSFSHNDLLLNSSSTSAAAAGAIISLLLNSLSHNDLLLNSLSHNHVTQQLVTQRFVIVCFVT